MKDIHIENIGVIKKLQDKYTDLRDFAPRYFAMLNQYISGRLSEIESILSSLKSRKRNAKRELSRAESALRNAQQPRYHRYYDKETDSYYTETYYIDTTPYENAVYSAQEELRNAEQRLSEMKFIYNEVNRQRNKYMSLFDSTKSMTINFSQQNIEFMQEVAIIFNEYIDIGKEKIISGNGSRNNGSGNSGNSNAGENKSSSFTANSEQTTSNYFNQKVLQNWGSFAVDERKNYLTKFAKEVSENSQIGISKTVFVDMSPYSRGSFNPTTKLITVNSDILTNPTKLKSGVRTILHETRHGFQKVAVDNPEKYGITKETMQIWKNNFANYKSSELDYEAYYNQPIEVDARNFADGIVNKIKM